MAIWKTVLALSLMFNLMFNLFFKKIPIIFLLVAINFIASKAYSMTGKELNQWKGTVTYVTDGDTLWVRPDNAATNSEPRKIRISGIDAPESCQLYGAQSTLALKGLLAAKTITVSSKRFDDYGRDVAKITINNIDVGAWMVRNGHAWSYHYRHSAGPYRIEEEAATRARLGLFADTAAIEPRLFRREHGSCHVPKDASEHPIVHPRKRYK
jgi:micrococcal nuclease